MNKSTATPIPVGSAILIIFLHFTSIVACQLSPAYLFLIGVRLNCFENMSGRGSG